MPEDVKVSKYFVKHFQKGFLVVLFLLFPISLEIGESSKNGFVLEWKEKCT